MGPGQVGANGGSAARPVEEDGGGEIESVHLHCMGGGLVMGRHLRLVAAEIMAAVVREYVLTKTFFLEKLRNFETPLPPPPILDASVFSDEKILDRAQPLLPPFW